VQALASAVGPLFMRFVYHYTKNGNSAFMGPGSMFIAASLLYIVAAYCAYELPVSCVGESAAVSFPDLIHSFLDKCFALLSQVEANSRSRCEEVPLSGSRRSSAASAKYTVNTEQTCAVDQSFVDSDSPTSCSPLLSRSVVNNHSAT
jgi:hypothetical protein